MSVKAFPRSRLAGARNMQSRLHKKGTKRELDLAWSLYEKGQKRKKARSEQRVQAAAAAN